MYYNYRYYSPKIGRWISRDMIEEFGGIHLNLLVTNNIVNYYDYYGLSGDVTHGTEKCYNNDSCSLLTAKTLKWIYHYAERQRELLLDKYNLKKLAPERYNTHIDEAQKARQHVLKCTKILIDKINNCGCDSFPPPHVPRFSPKALPSKVLPQEESSRKRPRQIHWDKVRDVITFGGLAVVLTFVPFDGPLGEMSAGSAAFYYFLEIYE